MAGRIALGKLTLIAGDPGLGKSFLTLDLAARVSRGWEWPGDGDPFGDGEGVVHPPGGVVLLNAEDAVGDTIRPRLDAAGADVTRIIALEAVETVTDGRRGSRSFDLSRDLPALERAIVEVGDCRLVVIDPVSAYLGGTDSHKNADVRGLLAPLSALAEKHKVAVLAVTHLNKAGAGPAIYRAMGSLAFTAAARAAWAVVKDKDDPRRRLFVPIKNNIAPDVGGLAYRIDNVGVGDAPVVAWEAGRVEVTADDAMTRDAGGSGGGRTEREDCGDWLAEYLTDGPRLVSEVESEAKAAGFTSSTLRRAKAATGVDSRKRAFGEGWEWVLCCSPSEGAHTAKALTEDAHTPAGEHLREKQGDSP